MAGVAQELKTMVYRDRTPPLPDDSVRFSMNQTSEKLSVGYYFNPKLTLQQKPHGKMSFAFIKFVQQFAFPSQRKLTGI